MAYKWKNGKMFLPVNGVLVRKTAELPNGMIRCAIKGNRVFIVGKTIDLQGTEYRVKKIYNGGIQGDLFPVSKEIPTTENDVMLSDGGKDES